MTAALSFGQLSALAPSLGIYDVPCPLVPCPLCSALHNPLRHTLRIWREREDFMGYACARCAEKGWSRSGEGAAGYLPADMVRRRLLDTAEAAEFCKNSIPHWRRLYRDGKVPKPVRLSARKYGSDLLDFIDARVTGP
jgi:hypothetical protein